MTMVTSNSQGKAPIALRIQNREIKVRDGANCRGLRLAGHYDYNQRNYSCESYLWRFTVFMSFSQSYGENSSIISKLSS